MDIEKLKKIVNECRNEHNLKYQVEFRYEGQGRIAMAILVPEDETKKKDYDKRMVESLFHSIVGRLLGSKIFKELLEEKVLVV